ncbi:MAG TPA: hypothetical protein VFW33_10510, partial [Gemmataceae bacterium]|nr:hypothetical protein [Gemmataceae bacterium]
PDSGRLYLHLPDVQGYLQEELAAAQKFLALPCNADLWQFCTPQLVSAVRGRQVEQLKLMRDYFRAAVVARTASEQAKHSTTAALAWAVVVESALLTDQLAQDMREAATARGCACAPEGWLPYYLPNPPPEARQAFAEYVRCRWPIHVFALDPAAQQQNIADAFSGRREMQLALSLAFVSGNLSASNMMRYARRIEYDFATIDVNGTAIGFSHGDDTFGWRFYPRFQTPDIQSNATVFVRDLLIGGPSKDAFLRQRRLEPGMRECVAVVIMPSFVPYATLNVSSNWFNLTNPKCKELDSAQAMRLSGRVKAIQNCAGRVGDADCYRDGDFVRLLEKARQLETRLPLQSAQVQVPYENTLGGFAMFNTGVTDLAPELTGWYGSPSINPAASTTLFLVGNHFSVHQTRVIAGGQFVASTEMLSRQVMKAVIPPNPILVGDACQKFVDVHLATPYGVTQHLLIPVCAAAGAAGGAAWGNDTFEVAFSYCALGIVPPKDATSPGFRPSPLLLKKPADVPDQYDTVDLTFTFDRAGAGPVTIAGNKLNGTAYQIPGDQLTAALFKQYGTTFGPQATNPPCTLTGVAKLTFKAGQDVLAGDRKSVPLTIKWVNGATCCGKCDP